MTSISNHSFIDFILSCNGVSSLRTKTFATFSISPSDPTFSGLCQHAAHARTSRYITDTTKERYHQCQNVNCSATFITYESVQRYIVKPGEVHAVRPHPLPSGQQIMWM